MNPMQRASTLVAAGRAALLIAAALTLAVLTGCASTQLKDTWKDPAFTGPPLQRVLVIGAFKSDLNRRVFEDAFTAALQAAKTDAVASYVTLPESGAIPNERVRAAVKSTGADAVLVTRVLRVRRDVNVTPAYMGPGFYRGGFYGWYGGAWAATPADVHVYDVLTVESTLWNMRTDKPVWAGTSEVTSPSNVTTASQEFAGVLIPRMKADGVIRRRRARGAASVCRPAPRIGGRDLGARRWPRASPANPPRRAAAAAAPSAGSGCVRRGAGAGRGRAATTARPAARRA